MFECVSSSLVLFTGYFTSRELAALRFKLVADALMKDPDTHFDLSSCKFWMNAGEPGPRVLQEASLLRNLEPPMIVVNQESSNWSGITWDKKSGWDHPKLEVHSNVSLHLSLSWHPLVGIKYS